jgi:hypothetical protein
MKRCLMGVVLVASLALGLARPALAADYSFRLSQETVNVYWESDGTLSLDYVFVFANDAGAAPIDFVDVGLPNASYNLGKIRAEAGGQALSDIQKSTYVQIGVAVGLGTYAIPGGKTGTVHVVIDGLSRVLYPDDQESTYASAVFSPTWFDSSVVHGKTDLTVIYHLPPGILPEEPRYHTASSPLPAQPEAALDDQGRVTYTWHTTNASGSSQYTVGASFPAKVVPAAAIVRASAFDKLAEWIGGMSGCCLPLGFVGFWIAMAVFGSWSAGRRKMQYLPPKISIEGHGIKRGLTAVEAAVLMEEPLDKALTMILFSVIKKGAASVVAKTPLRLQINPNLPANLYEYEADFLKAFGRTDAAAQKAGLQKTMVNLIKSVSEKMKGFSRKESVAYYKTIIEKAWGQVQTADTPEVKGQKFDEVMDWTLLDRDFAGRSRQVFGPGPVFVPMWWGRYSPPIHTGGGSVMPTGAGLGGALPHLPGADFAASIANGVQNFSSGVVGNLSSFTSAVTNATNPPPPPSSSSRGGGGGHSCACACACAGCACACAGGGR